MAQPPATPHLSRDLVRVLPFAAQKEFAETIADAATLIALFEIGSNVTDRNQLGSSPAPAGTIISATGPYLDAVAFSSGVGTLVVDYAIGLGVGVAAPLFREAVTAAVAAADLANISGLRITGRYVRVTFTNTSGGNADVELGVYVRSS